MDIREIRYSRRLTLRFIRGTLPSVILAGSHRSCVNQDSAKRLLQSLSRNYRTEERVDELCRGQRQARVELYSLLMKLNDLLKMECNIMLVNISKE